MNIVERAKKIIISPQTEWNVINNETPNTSAIITGYVLPLAGLAAIAAFIGYGLIGYNNDYLHYSGIDRGISEAVSVLVGSLLGIFISSFVIDMLAPTFGSQKNMGRSVQLVAYSYTPRLIGGLFAIIPSLAILGWLAGLYGFYLLYLGMPRLKNTPADKHVGYFVVSILVAIAVMLIVGLIISRIMAALFGLAYGTRGY